MQLHINFEVASQITVIICISTHQCPFSCVAHHEVLLPALLVRKTRKLNDVLFTSVSSFRLRGKTYLFILTKMSFVITVAMVMLLEDFIKVKKNVQWSRCAP